jgi:glutathione S-transferase
MPQLTLYYTPGASSMATHIALHEVGVPFELKLIELHRHENRKPDYLAVNPEGKVPTLVIEGGEPLTEVVATLRYLARRYPAAGLLPHHGDIGGEARVISWMSFIASTIHSARRAGDKPWREVFRLADARLGRNDWAVGRYSIADIHLFRLFWRFVDTLHPAASDYPNLSAHYDRMIARDAVEKTIAAESAVGYHLPR